MCIYGIEACPVILRQIIYIFHIFGYIFLEHLVFVKDLLIVRASEIFEFLPCFIEIFLAYERLFRFLDKDRLYFTDHRLTTVFHDNDTSVSFSCFLLFIAYMILINIQTHV